MPELRIQHDPPPRGPELWIRRLKANEVVPVTILSSSLWGTWTHWNGQRSGPCFRDKKDCQGCKAGLPRAWKGYLHVGNNHNRKEEFLELTKIVALALRDEIGPGKSYRGMCVRFSRGKGDKAGLFFEVQSQPVEGAKLPNEKSPLQTLITLWGVPNVVVTDDGGNRLAFANEVA
jgi:hypothetical protein